MIREDSASEVVYDGVWLKDMRKKLDLYPDELAFLLGEDVATSYVRALEKSSEILPVWVVGKVINEINNRKIKVSEEETLTPNQEIRVIKDELGLSTEEFARKLEMSVNFLHLLLSTAMPVSEERLTKARHLVGKEDKVDILVHIQRELELNDKQYAYSLGINTGELWELYNYKKKVSEKILAGARALKDELNTNIDKDDLGEYADLEGEDDIGYEVQHNISRKDFLYNPGHLYWRLIVNEIMNILNIDEEGLAKKLEVELIALRNCLHRGYPLSSKIVEESEKLLTDGQLKLLIENVEKRRSEFGK